MEFIADKQTLEDLHILDRYNSGSVFYLFNRTKTKGGAALLEKMFRKPLTDFNLINKRSGYFKYFQQQEILFPIDQEQLEVVENFFRSIQQLSWFTTVGRSVRRELLSLIGAKEEHNHFIQGLKITSDLLGRLDIFFRQMIKKDPETIYKEHITNFQFFYNDKRFEVIRNLNNKENISFGLQVKCMHLIGNVFYRSLLDLLDAIYFLDVCIAVGKVAHLNGFSYAIARPPGEHILDIKNCKYPSLKNGQGNDIRIDRLTNVIFLTGANMAGKSTLMKSIGISVYLAHMGFPVAADQMDFSVKDGIFSSINVPDDISRGYSHFYAEVLRVKTVAEAVSSSKNLLVIFDELFKGTNVKDAHDATVAVTEAFGEHGNCGFIVSTHITEAGEILKQTCNNIRFVYMPTIMQGNIPHYPYTLKDGISSDRHGMMIVENEGILRMLD